MSRTTLSLQIPLGMLSLSLLASCASDSGAAESLAADANAPSECSAFATSVVDHDFGPGLGEGQGSAEFPSRVLGPPEGAGCCTGGLDVTSLGNGGWVVLAFDAVVVDGPGADFIVFENSFNVGGDPESPFAELARVAVSLDAEDWHEFPCEATEYPYDQCAGWHSVLANADNPFDPNQPESAGGDAFDLSRIGIEEARFVRITDRADLDDALDCCFDLDAVGLVNFECEAGVQPDE